MTAAARYYRFFAGYADKIYGEVIPMDNLDMFDHTLREPIGVIAVLTPWNAPISILANSLAPALAAGNTIVVKPSEYTSVTTIEFAALVKEAGFPDGVVNVVTGGPDVGDRLTRHRGVGKIIYDIKPTVVPTALSGVNRWRFPSFGTEGSVSFGPPLNFDDLFQLPDCKETHQLIVDRVMEAIASLLKEEGSYVDAG